jgi:tetratricopeptide (TPR) repeat protein
LFNLGMTFSDMERHGEAVEALRRCLEISSPEESHVRKAYALCVGSLTRLNRDDAANDLCEAGLRLFPLDTELLFRRGILAHQQGKLDDAEEAYLAILNGRHQRYLSSMDIGLNGYKARHNLAAVYSDRGDFQHALEQWKQISLEFPAYGPAWRGLTECLVQLHLLDEAEDELERMPNDAYLCADRHLAISMIAMARNDIKSARRSLDEAQRSAPDDLEVLRAWCRHAFEHGTADEAAGALSRLVEKQPTDAAAHHNLANAYMRMQAYDAAIAAYQRSLALRPDSAATLFHLAHALTEVGRVEEARIAAQTAATFAPHDPVVANFSQALSGPLGSKSPAATVECADPQVSTVNPRPYTNAIKVASPSGISPKNEPWTVGDVIGGRWEIREVHRGGMAIVYIVVDRDSGVAYAAKTFQDKVLCKNPTIADRFEHEALAWINLGSHPNIVTAHFVDRIEGRPLLFLEYVAGGDLEALIGTDELLNDRPRVVRFALQICDAMIHASSKGIQVHRDLKPENCLLTGDRTLKITDFGLAKVFGESRSWSLRGPTAIAVPAHATRIRRESVGTPTHMAPEQFRSDDTSVDVRADIYAFGVTLWQLVTGRLPFNGGTKRELRKLHCEQPLPDFPVKADELTPIVFKCMAKLPSERYQEFAAVRADLEAVLYGLTGNRLPPAPLTAEHDTTSLLNRTHSLFNLGRFDLALQAAKLCVEAAPSSADAWCNLGAVQAALEKRHEAVASYRKALDVETNHSRAKLNYGASLAKLGRADEAIKCFFEVLTSYPENAHAWHNLGEVLIVLGQFERGLASINRALDFAPRIPEAWNARGAELLRRCSTAPADENVRPTNHFGQLANALEAFSRALELNPTFEAARSNLQRAFQLAVINLPLSLPCEPWVWKTAYRERICLPFLLSTLAASANVEMHPQFLTQLEASDIAREGGHGGLVKLGLSALQELGPKYSDPAAVLAGADEGLKVGSLILCELLIRQGFLDLPCRIAMAVRSTSASAGEQLELARIFHQAGVVYRRVAEYDRAIECYTLASELFGLARDDAFFGHAQFNLGMAYERRGAPGDWDRARQTYETALTTYARAGRTLDAEAVKSRLCHLPILPSLPARRNDFR